MFETLRPWKKVARDDHYGPKWVEGVILGLACSLNVSVGWLRFLFLIVMFVVVPYSLEDTVFGEIAVVFPVLIYALLFAFLKESN